jgi:hypothetical protein
LLPVFFTMPARSGFLVNSSSSRWAAKDARPGGFSHTIKPPTRIAAVREPGMPSASIGSRTGVEPAGQKNLLLSISYWNLVFRDAGN